MAEPRTCVVAEDEAILRHSLVAELRRAWPALQVVAGIYAASSYDFARR